MALHIPRLPFPDSSISVSPPTIPNSAQASRPLCWHQHCTIINDISSKRPGAPWQSEPGLTQCMGHRKPSINGTIEWKLGRPTVEGILGEPTKLEGLRHHQGPSSQNCSLDMKCPETPMSPGSPPPQSAAFLLSGQLVLCLQPQLSLPLFEGNGASFSGLSLAWANECYKPLGNAECSQERRLQSGSNFFFFF